MGEWKGGKRHGKGKYKSADRSTYDGEWFENLRRGDAIEKRADGSKYEGYAKIII